MRLTSRPLLMPLVRGAPERELHEWHRALGQTHAEANARAKIHAQA